MLTTDAGGCSATSAPCDNTTEVTPPIIDDFIIYPNPNDGNFRVTNQHDVQITELKIYDIYGNLVYGSKTGESNISLSGLPTGTYFLEITTANKKYPTKEFVIGK